MRTLLFVLIMWALTRLLPLLVTAGLVGVVAWDLGAELLSAWVADL